MKWNKNWFGFILFKICSNEEICIIVVISKWHVHLSRKEVCHVEISQTTMPSTMLLIPLESFCWVGVHQGGFIMSRPTTQRLLTTILSLKIPSIKTKHFREVGVCFWHCFESAQWVGFYGGAFINVDLRCMRYWTLNILCHWKFNTNSTNQFFFQVYMSC
jgi:hypothetical protein